MKILLLPGNSVENRDWIREITESLDDPFDEIITHEYDHWKKDRPAINFELELDHLQNKISQTDEYVIFAKSAGCILALLAIEKEIIQANSMIFVAIPFAWSRAKQYPLGEYLANLSIPKLFIAKAKDFLCEFEKLNAYLQKNDVKNFKTELYDVKGEPNDNHHYADTKVLKKMVLKFVK